MGQRGQCSMVDEPETTGRNQDGTFAPGVSGNPSGRPKGSRNKLSEDFFRVLAQKFEERGEAAVSAMIDERPHEFAKMIAGLQTKEVSGEDGAALFPTEVVWRRANKA